MVDAGWELCCVCFNVCNLAQLHQKLFLTSLETARVDSLERPQVVLLYRWTTVSQRTFLRGTHGSWVYHFRSSSSTCSSCVCLSRHLERDKQPMKADHNMWMCNSTFLNAFSSIILSSRGFVHLKARNSTRQRHGVYLGRFWKSRETEKHDFFVLVFWYHAQTVSWRKQAVQRCK